MNYEFAVVNKKLSHNCYKIFICSEAEKIGEYLNQNIFF